MRIVGLIAFYLVGLYLTGLLLVDMEVKSIRTEARFPVNMSSKKDSLSLSGSIPLKSLSDTLLTLPTWLKRPIGIVRYPDFPPINFLPNGD